MSSYGKHYLPQRIAHLVNLMAMILLIISGFYIYRPFVDGIMGIMRFIHFVAGAILMLNIIWRVYYSFCGKYKDYSEFKPEPGKILPVVKYYLLMGNKVATKGKYNPLQKLAYLIIPFLIIYQGVTGLALAYPDGMLAGFIHGLGGLANVRALHYLGIWVFICITLTHVYAMLFEAPQQFWAMFFGKEIASQPPPIITQADLNVRPK
jgi:Ni/Fe-hydrogenase 1 B-type cytochrome subunit